jgi:hypothetical protein
MTEEMLAKCREYVNKVDDQTAAGYLRLLVGEVRQLQKTVSVLTIIIKASLTHLDTVRSEENEMCARLCDSMANHFDLAPGDVADFGDHRRILDLIAQAVSQVGSAIRARVTSSAAPTRSE